MDVEESAEIAYTPLRTVSGGFWRYSQRRKSAAAAYISLRTVKMTEGIAVIASTSQLNSSIILEWDSFELVQPN